jgi:hypothetical protein
MTLPKGGEASPAANTPVGTELLHPTEPTAVATAVGAVAAGGDGYFRARRVPAERRPSDDEIMTNVDAMTKRLERIANGEHNFTIKKLSRGLPRTEALPTLNWTNKSYQSADRAAGYDIVRILASDGRLTVWLDADTLFGNQVPQTERAAPFASRALPTREGAACLRVASLFKDIQLTPHNLRIQCALNDIGLTEREITDREIMLTQALQSYGLTDTSGQSGRQIIRLSDYKHRIHDIVQDLSHSGNGTLETTARGQAYFRPASWLREWARLQDSTLPTGRLPLWNENGYFPALLRMAPFLDQSNDCDMHLLLGKNGGPEQFIEMGLRAGEYSRPDGSLAFSADAIHTFAFRILDSEVGPPVAAHRIASLLLAQARQYRQSFAANSFERLQVEGEGGYLPINYADKSTEMLAQDKRIVECQLRAEAALARRQHIDPHDPATLFQPGEVLHLCVGANPYTPMLGSIYSVGQKGAVQGWDIAPAVLEYHARLKRDPDHDLTRRQAWHEEIMQTVRRLAEEPDFKELDITPDLFKDAETMTRTQLEVVHGDIDKLPPHTFKRIYMHFALEATVVSRGTYAPRLRLVRLSLRDEQSRAIMVVTADSDPLYPGGKRKVFPAYTSDIENIKLAMLDAGLDIEVCQSIDEGLPDELRLRAGESFYLIVAKPRPAGAP